LHFPPAFPCTFSHNFRICAPFSAKFDLVFPPVSGKLCGPHFPPLFRIIPHNCIFRDAMRSLGCPIPEGGCQVTISPIKGDQRDGSNQDTHLQLKGFFRFRAILTRVFGVPHRRASSRQRAPSLASLPPHVRSSSRCLLPPCSPVGFPLFFNNCALDLLLRSCGLHVDSRELQCGAGELAIELQKNSPPIVFLSTAATLRITPRYFVR